MTSLPWPKMPARLVARMLSGSIATSTPSAGHTPYPHSRRHCRWWIEPCTSATSPAGNPARWN